jgi:hypothetical protein
MAQTVMVVSLFEKGTRAISTPLAGAGDHRAEVSVSGEQQSELLGEICSAIWHPSCPMELSVLRKADSRAMTSRRGNAFYDAMISIL